MENKHEPSRNTERKRKCLHFDNCNAVRCPLDELMLNRVKLPKDKIKCLLSKRKRMQLGKDMKTLGLNLYEIAALIRTYGSLEKGIKTILDQNFCVKNKVILQMKGKAQVVQKGRED